jgi:hypothetical protein
LGDPRAGGGGAQTRLKNNKDTRKCSPEIVPDTFFLALDRLLNTLPPIAPITAHMDSYYLIVLGTPVWGGRTAAPMRRFLKDYGPSLPAVAFFCTMGGSGAASTFEDMQTRLGKPPRASCSFDAKALDNGSYLGALDHFAMQLSGDAHPPLSRQPAPDGIHMPR